MWDVRVCVACLATNVRMYSMSASSLLQPYQLLAGVQLDMDNGYLPNKLCWECAALVNKFNLFRHKCERAHLLLQDIYNQHDEIIEQYVKEIDRERHNLSSSCSSTHICNYTLKSRNVKVTKDTRREPVVTPPVKHEFEVQIVKAEDDLVKYEPELHLNEPSADSDHEEAESDSKNQQEPGEEGSSLGDLNFKKEGIKEVSLQEPGWTVIPLTKGERYECDVCKLRFNTLRNIRRHINSQHSKQYTCNICHVKHFSWYTAQRHLKQHQKHGLVLKARKAESKLDKKARNVLKVKLKKKKQKLKDTLKPDDLGFAERPQTQEEMMAVVRERQLAKGYDTAPFKCHLCFKVFLENRTYSQHMTVHDPARGDFECDICKIRLKTRLMVWKHITRNHLRKYTCNICPNVSCNRLVAQNHYQTHKGVRFMCHVCAATFSREAAMQAHVLKKHPTFTMNNVCGDCGASFPTNNGLFCHKNKMHQVATLPEENAPYCEDCKVQFASRKAWTKHVLNSESHKDLQKDIVNGCIQCGETFHNNAALRRHRKEQHTDKNLAKKIAVSRRKPQPCALEYKENVEFTPPKAKGRRLTFKDKLDEFDLEVIRRKVHQFYYANEAPTIDKCGERMTSSNGRWAHHRRCHPGQPYLRITPAKYNCEQCGKHFNTKDILEQHRVMHTGAPPLQCGICSRAFYMQSALKQHLAITHSEERPYKCDACEMSFKVKPALKRHLYVHTGEKPYACTECEKAFTTRDWLQLHIRKVHKKEHIPTKPRVRKRKPPV